MSAAKKDKRGARQPDASLNVALNGIRVLSPAVAARAKVPVGEVVAWAVAFPRSAS